MELSEVILLTAALGLLALAARALCARLSIPYTAFLVVLGTLLGWAAERWSGMQHVLGLQLTPEIVLFVFLPVLIFESAFNLHARELMRCLAPILTLAVPALLLSTLVVGLGLSWLLDMDLTSAMLFGALISATDPVAVVALFKELGAPKRLTMLVEGESLFNDAVAIVLFNILLGLSMSDSMYWSALGHAGYEFLWVFFGGLLCGGLAGFAVCELFHVLREKPYTMMLVSLCLAYLVFAVAEHMLHVSGVMAVLAAAMVMSFLMLVRASQASSQAMTETWGLIAIAGNSLLFLLVGLSVDLGRLIQHLPLVGAAVVLVLLGRAAAVYLLLPLVTRLFALPGASFAERHIIWWGGLKGGLALAIALSVPHALSGRDMIIDMTVGVVLFFLLVNGSTIKTLMRYLGLNQLTREENAERQHVLGIIRGRSEDALQRLHVAGALQDDAEAYVRIQSILGGSARNQGNALPDGWRLPLLRVESLEYHALYDMGLLNTYTYLELCSDVYARRRACLTGKVDALEAHTSMNRLQYWERLVLKWLRELESTAGLLARYQDFRLTNAICKHIALILGCRKALDSIPADADAELASAYHLRMQEQLDRLRGLADMLPDYYQNFMERLACRVALGAARDQLENEYHRGLVGPRNYRSIDWRIQEGIHVLSTASDHAHRISAVELIKGVPLLEGLSQDILKRLVHRARIMRFLQGDDIIRSGEHGDAMYIILAGQVGIYKGDGGGDAHRVTMLERSGFFGEVALLGDHVRTATVRSETLVTLLRLRRQDVLEVARGAHELEQRLQQSMRERSA